MLLHNADFVITVDSSRRVLTGASLVIRDGRIADLGKTAEIEARRAGAFGADQIVDGPVRCSRPASSTPMSTRWSI